MANEFVDLSGAEILYDDLRKRAASADENMAEYFSTTKRYAVGDMCMYQDKLYKCTTAVTNAGAWNANNWTQVKAGAEFSALNDEVSDLKSAIDSMNGAQDIGLTELTEPMDVSNATAEYDSNSGTLHLYGTSGSVRYFCCFNGQALVKSSIGEFVQSLPAGAYKVNIQASGNVPSGFTAYVKWTTTTLANGTNVLNGAYIVSDSPIMVGIYIKNMTNYGTSENPTIITASFTAYPEKLNKSEKTAIEAEITTLSGEVDDITDKVDKISLKYDNIGYITAGRTEQFYDATAVRVDDTTIKFYGTTTNTGIRYIAFMNGYWNTMTTSSNLPKVFPAGTYKVTYSFSPAAIADGGIRIIKTTSSSAPSCPNGTVFTIDDPFMLAMRVPVTTNYGTEENPTVLTITVEQLRIGTRVLYPTGDDTDRTEDIENALNAYRCVTLAPGEYYVTGIKMPQFTTLIGSGHETKIILKDSVTTGCAVWMANKCTVKNCNFIGAFDDITFTEGTAGYVNIGTRHGIMWKGEATGTPSVAESAKNTHFEGIVTDCRFQNFTGGAITCESTGYSTDSGINAVNCQISRCGAGINVAWWSEFNRFCNFNIFKCYHGIINNGGNNEYANCNISKCEVGFFMTGLANRCVLYDGTSASPANDGHGIATGCTINHSGLFTENAGTAIYVYAIAAGFVFCGLQLHYGKLFMRQCSRMQFVSAYYGSNVEFTCYSKNSYLFSSCFVHSNAKMYPYDETTGNLITTFDEDGNLPRIKFINCFDGALSPVTVAVLYGHTVT